jgi:hypothetical protein
VRFKSNQASARVINHEIAPYNEFDERMNYTAMGNCPPTTQSSCKCSCCVFCIYHTLSDLILRLNFQLKLASNCNLCVCLCRIVRASCHLLCVCVCNVISYCLIFYSNFAPYTLLLFSSFSFLFFSLRSAPRDTLCSQYQFGGNIFSI